MALSQKETKMKSRKSTFTSSRTSLKDRLLMSVVSVALCILMPNGAMAQGTAAENSFFGNMNETEYWLFLAMMGLLGLTLLIVVVFFYVLAVLKLLREENKPVIASSVAKAPKE